MTIEIGENLSEFLKICLVVGVMPVVIWLMRKNWNPK